MDTCRLIFKNGRKFQHWTLDIIIRDNKTKRNIVNMRFVTAAAHKDLSEGTA